VRKHEFVDGAAIAMAGATEAHNIIYDGLDDLDPIQDEANE
jgi:hypothetical protein